MVDRSSVSGLGLVAIAVVSAGAILASYHLIHRCAEPNVKMDNIGNTSQAEQRRQNVTKRMKKVRFVDNLTALDTSSSSDDGELPCGTTGLAC